MVYLFGPPHFQKEKLLTAKWKLSWWIANPFFFQVLKIGRASGILTALYIFGLIILHVLPWYAQNQRINSLLFFKAAQDQFHFLLSEESEGITLWVYHCQTTLYLSSSTRLLTITCVFVLVAFNCFSVFILCWWTLAQSCEDLASIRATVLQCCFSNC